MRIKRRERRRGGSVRRVSPDRHGRCDGSRARDRASAGSPHTDRAASALSTACVPSEESGFGRRRSLMRLPEKPAGGGRQELLAACRKRSRRSIPFRESDGGPGSRQATLQYRPGRPPRWIPGTESPLVGPAVGIPRSHSPHHRGLKGSQAPPGRAKNPVPRRRISPSASSSSQDSFFWSGRQESHLSLR